jgi:hypothetical protein
MRKNTLIRLAALLAVVGPAALTAQDTGDKGGSSGGDSSKATKPALQPAITIQHLRPQDKRGINVFEAPKDDAVPFLGFKLDFGAAFTQQFQGLKHENAAAPRLVNNVNQNQLMEIGNGFNNASANLYVNAQLAPGIRVALTTYLSSRHHQETWVKDGYLLIDESPIDVAVLNTIMKYVTVKAGHFEINYGDAHFRRSDNGNAMYNPFVGNLILDAFTTEVGGEVYARANGFLAMFGVTGGEIRGNVLAPNDRGPAFITKLGFDRQFTPELRVRLTGSNYRVEKSPANTLFAGDRAGSRYFFVLENTAATSTAQASSGLVNPGFRYKVNAYQINPFIKLYGAELFGVYERAEGRAAIETTERTWEQFALDAVYRFAGAEKLFVGGRYNTAWGTLSGIANEVNVDRFEIGGGWFITPTIMLKGEYVNQRYFDFPLTDIRRNGKFNGFVIEGVVAF